MHSLTSNEVNGSSLSLTWGIVEKSQAGHSVHACNSSTQEAEAGESLVGGQVKLDSKTLSKWKERKGNPGGCLSELLLRALYTWKETITISHHPTTQILIYSLLTVVCKPELCHLGIVSIAYKWDALDTNSRRVPQCDDTKGGFTTQLLARRAEEI
jgi:hypothetical protein